MISSAVAAWAAVAAAVVGAATSITSSVISNNNAKRAQEEQKKYQQQMIAEQKAAEAKEKQARLDAQERNSAYGASLLDGNSQLNNVLTDSWSNLENDEGDSLILGKNLLSGETASAAPAQQNVSEMFA